MPTSMSTIAAYAEDAGVDLSKPGAVEDWLEGLSDAEREKLLGELLDAEGFPPRIPSREPIPREPVGRKGEKPTWFPPPTVDLFRTK